MMTDEILMVVKTMELKRVRMAPGARDRREQLLAKGKCLGCEEVIEDGERVTCGLCLTCYQSARHFIRKKKVTEQDLVRQGKMLPPRPTGPRPANKFTRELSEL